jgi:hypothetical protein
MTDNSYSLQPLDPLHSVHPLLADGPLPDPRTLETQSPPANSANNDPLIAKGWQHVTYAGVALLAVGILALVGWLSRKIEHVVIVGLILSLILIAVFFFFLR